MRLALAEMRRRRGRWASIVGAVGFIVFLVLVLAALADGLFIGSAFLRVCLGHPANARPVAVHVSTAAVGTAVLAPARLTHYSMWSIVESPPVSIFPSCGLPL